MSPQPAQPPLLVDTEYPDELHWLPADDLREHEASGGCWCRPRREVELCDEHGGVHFLWHHHAADGRDLYALKGWIPLQ